jgi:hypothetical protein
MAHDDGFVHHAALGWFVSGKVSPKLFLEVFGVEIKEAVTVVLIDALLNPRLSRVNWFAGLENAQISKKRGLSEGTSSRSMRGRRTLMAIV